MSMRERWDFLVLHALRNGQPVHLRMIYEDIAELPRIEGMENAVNPASYHVDPAYGDRPRYTHSVRSTISKLLKRGMVEHIGKGRTGVYRITDNGLKHLALR